MRAPLFVTAFAGVAMAGGHERPFGPLAEASEIPMLWRRRLESLALATVRAGLGAVRTASAPVQVVFAGRHGDLPRTQRLLFGMVDGQPPSPLVFSLSVHNALAGMLDLLRGERTGHTSLAAGRASFDAALTETAMRLQVRPERGILLLYVEYPIPEELQARTDPGLGGTVLAVRIERAREEQPARAVIRRVPAAKTGVRDGEVEARRVLAALQGGPRVQVASRTGLDWCVEARG